MLARSLSNPAVTRFTSTSLPGKRSGLRAFLLKPETGKTHQLRVALKSLGAPVLGDERYAQAELAQQEERGYLHCAALRFLSPDGPVQIMCEPEEGQEFRTEAFQTIFKSWFPDTALDNLGVWFPDSKLMRSSLLD